MSTPRKDGNKAEYIRTWTTEDELLWLEGLGTGFHSKTVFVPRKVLLKRYWITCLNRDNWGAIDRERVAEYIEKEIGG